MSEQNDVGAAYLAALKRSSVSPTAETASARASDPAQPPESLPFKAIAPGRTGPVPEKRRSPRYRCQGSAQLREVSTGIATWATFSDISMHGCYVEAAAGYPAGSTLTLSIEVNGFRVEAIGEVRVTYPGLGMGISFTQVSDEDRSRLRELVRSISQPSVIMGARPADRATSASSSIPLPTVANPGAALQAIQKLFEDRHVMGREEFIRILRKSQ
jgi:PilZ domain